MTYVYLSEKSYIRCKKKKGDKLNTKDIYC